MRLRILLGFLVVALIAAILIWFFQPLQAKGRDERGIVKIPTSLVQSPETSGVGPTAAGTARLTPVPFKGSRYVNKIAGYSLIVPDGWRRSGPGPYTIFLVRKDRQYDGEPPSFRVGFSIKASEQVSPELAAVGTSPSCAEPKHSVEVDAFPAERWLCDISEGQSRFLSVIVKRGEMRYWLGGPIAVEHFERDFPVFEGILASIEFIEIETPPPSPTAVPSSTPKAAP